MTAIQDRLSVVLIATPRLALNACGIDERLADVMARNQGGFDYFPVTGTALQGQEQIVGLVELVPFLRGNPACGVVRDYLLPLAEDNLIGADAGILTFVRTADRHPCRLVVSGSQVSGLVSLSDLQKLPVRAALFALITQLEMTMANAIRRELGNTDGWKERLPDDRKEKIDCQRKMVAADGNLVDDLLFTQYCDKITIIRRSPAFKASKGRFKDEMDDVQKLRDSLAHANDYATTREAAAKVCAIVRSVEEWMKRLNDWLSNGPAEGGAA